MEAPTAGSVILAGVLLKMGTYGLLRFAFPLFPLAAAFFAPYLAALAVVGIVYGALVAMVQPDLKKLVAYSSVSHLGFVVLGISAMNAEGVQGAVYQMLAHGVSTGGLFLLVGMLVDRRHTRLIAEFGGLKNVMPRFVAVFLLVTLSSIGLPGLNGFVGEFLILLGTFAQDPRLAAVAATGVILSAVYMLWMFQRVNYGEVRQEENARLRDLSPREWAVLVPIVAVIVLMGVLPNLFLRPIAPSVDRALVRMRRGRGRTGAGLPMMASLQRDRADGVRDGRGPGVDAGRGVPRAGRAHADRAARGRRPGGGGPGDGRAVEPRRLELLGVVEADNFGLFVTGVLIVVGLLSLAISAPVVEREHLPQGEYYALMLFGLAGMMLMATASDLLVIFLALEVLSLSVYVLTGIRRDSPTGAEAAFKYFFLGGIVERVLSLRHRLDLRHDRQHAPGSDRRAGRRAVALADADAARRDRPAARRVRVQGVGRAVSHVDARRLRGRAGGGDRLHVHGREGRGVRGVRRASSCPRSSRFRRAGSGSSGPSQRRR